MSPDPGLRADGLAAEASAWASEGVCRRPLQLGNACAFLGYFSTVLTHLVGFPDAASSIKNLRANAGDIKDVGSIPGLRRSAGEGNGNHSSILAWEIPCTEEPGGTKVT